MNRYDEIQMIARDIATNVHADPAKRDAMADDLIKLCTAIVSAVGKGVAAYGEREMYEAEVDRSLYHVVYLAGEQMQTGAVVVRDESSNAAVDLDRYHRPGPGDWCACGHSSKSHGDSGCIGESHNGHACEGGPCTGFTAVQRPPVWQHTDRRPAMFRDVDERGVMFIPPGMQASGLKPGQRITDLWGGACVKCGQTGRHANSCPTTKTIKDGS